VISRAHRTDARLRARDPKWAWKFRLLEAKAYIWQGSNEEAVRLLNVELPVSLASGDLEIEYRMLRGMALARLGKPEVATQELQQAMAICDRTQSPLKGELFNYIAAVHIQVGELEDADSLLRQGLRLTHPEPDKYQQAVFRLNLTFAALRRERYDEALYWSKASAEIARSINAQLVLEKDLGNVGWAYYKLGEPERALTNFEQAEQWAGKLGAKMDQVRRLHNAGLAKYQLNSPRDAEVYYQRTLDLAREIQSPDDILDTETDLAFLLLQRGDFSAAKEKCAIAIRLANSIGDKSAVLDPMFLQALLMQRSGDWKNAEVSLKEVQSRSADFPSLRWEVEDELAKLYAAGGDLIQADQWFQRSIATFEVQRSSLRETDSRLPFFTNASQVYGDYAEFLVNHGRQDEALKLTDLGRARTLTEGLGIAPKESRSLLKDDRDAKSVARRLNGTILSYWLGENESYLWAITPSQIRLFKLPKKSEIDSLVRTYQKKILSSNDLLASENPTGQALYETLIGPAQVLIPKNSKVFIIADGSLNQLNFESLLVPKPTLHYWIEDAVVTSADSVRMLAAFASHPRVNTPGGLLLIGDPVLPPAFEQLPNASREAASVEKHFQPPQRLVLTRERALPAAYASNHPERYSYIHFVAHGTASRLNPLESAVILSRTPGDPDTFKLYARDIMRHPLQAQLVTISACEGSGVRSYAGEGLVGLSWAFLRAGSHYVTGALWDVNDSATPQMMDDLYGGMERGQTPDVAMRNAKLAMMHSQGTFRKPLYWASFQMYAGS
jgi:CHAT domain-containing protein/Tfp pilus assembly protein PilF